MLQRSVLTLGGNASRRRASTSIYKYLQQGLLTRKQSVAEGQFLSMVARTQRQREKKIEAALAKASSAPASKRRGAGAAKIKSTGPAVAYQRNMKTAERELRRLAAARRQRIEAAVAAAAKADAKAARKVAAPVATPVATPAAKEVSTYSSASKAMDPFFRRLEASRAKRVAAIERLLAQQKDGIDTTEIDADNENALNESEVVEALEAVPEVQKSSRRGAARQVAKKAVTGTEIATEPLAATPVLDDGVDDATQQFLRRLEEETERRRSLIESALAEQQQPQQRQPEQRRSRGKKTVLVSTEAPQESEPSEEPVETVEAAEADDIEDSVAPAAVDPPVTSVPPPRASRRTVARPKPVEQPVRVVALPPRLVPLRTQPSVARTPTPVHVPAAPAQARVHVQVPISSNTGLFRI